MTSQQAFCHKNRAAFEVVNWFRTEHRRGLAEEHEGMGDRAAGDARRSVTGDEDFLAVDQRGAETRVEEYTS